MDEDVVYEIIEEIDQNVSENMETFQIPDIPSGSVPLKRGKYQKTANVTRHRIVKAYSSGTKICDICKYENLPHSSVSSIINIWLKTGRIDACEKGGCKHRKISEPTKVFIQESVDADCTLSLKKIADMVYNKFKIRISHTAVFKALRVMHYTLKMIRTIPLRRNLEQNIEVRRIYGNMFIELEESISPNKIIFLDEVGFNVSMRIKQGRAVIGQTPSTVVTNIRSRNISICCAMSRLQIIHKKMSNSPFNGNLFLDYMVELHDILKYMNLNGCCFIMDNVAFHKCASVKEFITANGHTVQYLPPYSPALNPIEEAFSKWKNFVKRSNCMSSNDLNAAIQSGFESITFEDCDGYYRHMRKNVRKAIQGETLED